MFKFIVLTCFVICVVVEARPKWQFLPPVPGYVPVYIRPGDTPLDEINPELAEAFHALPAGRSAGKQVEAESDEVEVPEAPAPHEEIPDSSSIDRRPYEKKIIERKTKKVTSIDIPKPVVRR